MGGGGATALPHSFQRLKYFWGFLSKGAVKDVDQQSRGGEEITREHADWSAVSLHGVQEEIPPCQRG